MRISDLIQICNSESIYLGLKMLKDFSDFGKFLNFAKVNLQHDEYEILKILFENLKPDKVHDYIISCQIEPLTRFQWYSVGIETLHNMIKSYERI